MAASGERRGEEIAGTTVSQPQPLAEGGNGKGEVAHADIGVGKAGEMRAEVALVHREDRQDAEAATGEGGDVAVREEEMGVGSHANDTKAAAEGGKDTGFHHGGIGFKEIACGQAVGRKQRHVSETQFGLVAGEDSRLVGAEEAQRRRTGRENKKQVLALVVDSHDMNLTDGGQGTEGLVPVEHGRQFQHDDISLGQQFISHRRDIRGTISEIEHPASVVVTARGVEEDDAAMGKTVKEGGGIGAMDADMGQAQAGKVVADQVAKAAVAFHVRGAGKQVSKGGEVHSEASREVTDRVKTTPAGQHAALIAGSDLGRALLHVDMRRIDDAFGRGPVGQFLTRSLPALYLVQGKGQVNVRITLPTQGQLADVSLTKLVYEFVCCHVALSVCGGCGLKAEGVLRFNECY